MMDLILLEGHISEVLCCPGGCLRSEDDCWRNTMVRTPMQLPGLVKIVERERAAAIEHLRGLLREADEALYAEMGVHYRNSEFGQRIVAAFSI